jgi:hypothetical protein
MLALLSVNCALLPQSVGCDNKLNSTDQNDYCGECDGNNDTCTIVTGKYTEQQQRSGK